MFEYRVCHQKIVNVDGFGVQYHISRQTHILVTNTQSPCSTKGYKGVSLVAALMLRVGIIQTQFPGSSPHSERTPSCRRRKSRPPRSWEFSNHVAECGPACVGFKKGNKRTPCGTMFPFMAHGSYEHICYLVQQLVLGF